MNTPTTGTNRIWPNWWRLGGVDGLIFVVLFVIGALVLQGEVPAREDSIESVREYFADDGEQYLIGDYLLGIGFVIFFLPYLIALRWFIGTGEGWPPIWSWMAFTGGLGVVIFGAAGGISFGALAMGLKDNPELDDATIRFLVDANAYTFSVWSFFLALFVGSAGFVILRSGVLWRWLGAAGLLAAVFLIIGAAWPIDGDQDGGVAVIGLPGVMLTLLFVIASSIGMIMRKDPPLPDGRG